MPSLHPEDLRTPGGDAEEAPRTRRIFVNRNLRMDKIELVGFDMDYTLAPYTIHEVEQLSFDLAVDRLISDFGYPEELAGIPYDRAFVTRGLVIDKKNGNLLKMNRFNHVGRAFHGRRALEKSERVRLYREEKIELDTARYAWMDTLFAMPEASIYAEAIERLEGKHPLSYGKLYDDIREAIDTIHRDGTLKDVIQADIGRYLTRDPDLGPSLHRLRSSGKKLFVLTNSLWPYTEAVMRFLLDGVLPEYPSWRHYFDYIVVGGAKPRFFHGRQPFLELDAAGAVRGEAGSLERGKIYQGGNLLDFETMTGFRGERVLYVGDHIYGDILQSKKSSLWRTCMVVEELERELDHLDAFQEELHEVTELERARARLEDELSLLNARLSAWERGSEDAPEATKRQATQALEALRKALRRTIQAIQRQGSAIEDAFNPYWGLVFKEGNENSRFGGQVGDYACLYTSRASNFLFTSPMQYFRSPRTLMPHEIGRESLSPFGADERIPGDTRSP